MTWLYLVAGVYLGVGLTIAARSNALSGFGRLLAIPAWPFVLVIELIASGDQ